MYYIETNAVRALGKRLLELPPRGPTVYTSALTVLELLSGLSEEEFAIRQSLLRTLRKSEVRIDWDMPATKLSAAFRAPFRHDSRSLQLQATARHVEEASSYNDAAMRIRLDKAAWALEQLIEVDKLVADPSREEQMDKKEEFLADYPKEIRRKALSVYRKSAQARSGAEDKAIKEAFKIAFMAILLKTAQGAALALFQSQDKRLVFKMVQAYDHSLDYQIVAMAVIQMKQLFEGRVPGRNDFYDTSHLMYLGRSKSVRIVTDDTLLVNVFKTRFPRQHVSVAEFVNRISGKRRPPDSPS